MDTDDDGDLESVEDDEVDPSDEVGADASDDEENENGDSDLDADGDIEMDDAPPILPRSKQPGSKPTVTVTPVVEAKLNNGASKDMDLDDDDDDDEELSELDSDAEGEEPGDDAPPEEVAEEEEIEEEEEDDEDDESESDSGTPITGSRASTPDVSKMTKRQRGRIELGGDFLQLPMGKCVPTPLVPTAAFTWSLPLEIFDRW